MLYNSNLAVATRRLNRFLRLLTAAIKGLLLTMRENRVKLGENKKRRSDWKSNASFRYLILLKIIRLHELVLCYQK